MIRLVIKKGVQTITEHCETCNCKINDLTIDDIIVKPKALSGVTVKDTKGNEVTRTGPREKCYCNHCSHD
jgi:hypothetical protein